MIDNLKIKHGQIIVEQYEQWMSDNGIKIADFRKK